MTTLETVNKVKKRYPDAILLFSVGDAYEVFGTDAVIVSALLGIGIAYTQHPLAFTAFDKLNLDTYLCKIVKAGYKVALCNELN